MIIVASSIGISCYEFFCFLDKITMETKLFIFILFSHRFEASGVLHSTIIQKKQNFVSCNFDAMSEKSRLNKISFTFLSLAILNDFDCRLDF